MERDPKTGRFLPGNKAAVGNKGNTKPKWGNKNAFKHGLFSSLSYHVIEDDGWLKIVQNRVGGIRISPTVYYQEEDGSVVIRTDVAEALREKGFVLQTW